MSPSEGQGDPSLAGTGRHLTAAELFAWTRFLDAGRLIEELLANHLSLDHAMSHREYEVLVRLDGSGGRMRLTELARQIVASAPLVTQTVNRLEQRGLVAREQSSVDRRGVDAVLTDAGREALSAASYGHAELIREFLLDPMSDDEIEVVGRVMERVSKKLRNERR